MRVERRGILFLLLLATVAPGAGSGFDQARAAPGAAAGVDQERAAPGAAAGVDQARAAPGGGAGFDRALARADSLLQRREAASAAVLLVSVRAAAVSAGARADELTVLLAQARLNGLVGLPKPGRESASAALALASAMGDTLATCRALRWLAVAAQHEGAMAEARAHARRLLGLARPRGDRFHEGQGLLLMAFSDLRLGFLEAAEDEYEAAIPAFVEVRNVLFELMARQGLGQILEGRREVEGARRCFLRVLEGSRELGDPYGEARALNDLGVLESMYGDPSAAVGFYRQAFDLAVANGDLRESVTTATNLAIAHEDMGEFEEALELHSAMRRRCEEAGYGDKQAEVLEEMGTVRRRRGEYREAAALYRAAAALAPVSSPDQLANSLIGLAEVLALQDSLAAARGVVDERLGRIRGLVSTDVLLDLERLQGSLFLRLDRPGEAVPHLREAERLGGLPGRRQLAGILADLGRCQRVLGRPDSARAALRRAVDAWESGRARVRDPHWRELLENDGRRLYSEVIAFTLEDSASAPAEERTRAAFDALQRFKARTLRERMLGAIAATRAVRGSTVGAAGESGDQSTVGIAGRSTADSLGAREVSAEALGATVALSDLQGRWLEADELLLDFFLGDEAIYLFGVTRTECRASRVACDVAELRRSLLRYRELVSIRPGLPEREATSAEDARIRLIDAAARRLASTLLSPVADLVRDHERIVLALDGELHLVPVEAWPVAVGTNAAGVPVERLLAHGRITRVPSAALLRDLRARAMSRSAGARPPRVLAILGAGTAGSSTTSAAERPPRDQRPPFLRGAAEEVRWLRREFRGVRVCGAADSAVWSADLARCDVVHLASHVRIDDVHPWRSGLPQLRASRIAGLRLPAELVFLAGCESAGGRLVSGEGVLGLTSAFVSAGVPTVVATLWPVSDRVTGRLTRSFYSELARGRPAGRALRAAQEAVRRDPGTDHPFFWAGFVLVGEEGTVVPLARRWTGPLVLGFVALAALAIGGIGAARRRRRSP